MSVVFKATNRMWASWAMKERGKKRRTESWLHWRPEAGAGRQWPERRRSRREWRCGGPAGKGPKERGGSSWLLNAVTRVALDLAVRGSSVTREERPGSEVELEWFKKEWEEKIRENNNFEEFC